MKVVDIDNATSPLADYIPAVRSEPLVVTDHGVPTAVILPLTNTDMETVALSTNPDFIALIERSRARARAEGGISSDEMRRRVLDQP
jgi:antitoxin (DNA-binding transcriptional repressor) of toxin-antitoxin stability system